MKLFMYHYVRNERKEQPFSKHKNLEEFKDECQFLKEDKTFLSVKELFQQKTIGDNFVGLTFDDGLKDHLLIAEFLNSHNINATFYIPVLPYLNHEILDVHKAHLVCSKIGPESLDLLFKVCSDLGINLFQLENKKEKEKYFSKYINQLDHDRVKEFKKIINYYGNLNFKSKILNAMLDKLNISKDSNSFYLSKEEIIYIHSLGFEIGSHGVSHTLLSRLNIKKQKKELLDSKIFLENIIENKIESFCYPYGTKNSFNQDTLILLEKLGYKNAVSVESRDITKDDILQDKYSIPRYDCNEIRDIYKI